MPRIQAERLGEFALGIEIPSLAKRGEVIERFADVHPGIKRDGVRHVREPGFNGHFMARRVHAEDSHLAGSWPEQIQKTFDSGGFARAVAAEKAVASPGHDSQTEAVHGVHFSVAPKEMIDFDDGGTHIVTPFVPLHVV